MAAAGSRRSTVVLIVLAALLLTSAVDAQLAPLSTGEGSSSSSSSSSSIPALLASSSSSSVETASSLFDVVGFLSGSDFYVNYSFQAIGTLQDGVAGTPSAAYLVSSAVGSRSFTDPTGVTTVASFSLVAPGGVGGNNNVLYPNSPTPLADHTLFDFNGLTFSLSVAEPVIGWTSYAVINLFWDTTLSSPQYSEEGASGSHETNITAADFTATLIGSPSSSSSAPAASSSPSSAAASSSSAATLSSSSSAVVTASSVPAPSSSSSAVFALPSSSSGSSSSSGAGSSSSVLIATSSSSPSQSSSLAVSSSGTASSSSSSSAALTASPSSSSSSSSVPSTPVSVLGDPQFVGLLGQSYQVHGLDGAVYALISEQHAQVNARFAFLTGPRGCPRVQQQQPWSETEPATAIACWSHDGSYLSELGLFTPTARLFIQAGSAATGFATVAFNGSSSSELSYQRLSSHQLSVTLGSFTLYVDNSDGFVNLASVKPLRPLKQLSSHGLLGQTHRRPAEKASKSGGLSQVIEGEVDDYVVDGGLFAYDAMYNRYAVSSQ